jgi:cell division protein FtsZ
MGELVLAKQGIHEAFAAADHMICESIKAVIRLVIRPGLINVGLDDLMSALRTNRSRCLFGSGIAEGKDRASKALKNALNSPLLDQGALLKDAQTVLVHLSGGEDLTLFEIELLMQRLQKFVPEKAHVLFGAAIDPAMGDSLSITLISALPEDSLAMAPRETLSHRSPENALLDPTQGFTSPPVKVEDFLPPREEKPISKPVSARAPEPVPEPEVARTPEPPPRQEAVPTSPLSKFRKAAGQIAAAAVPSLFDDERPFAEPDPGTKKKAPEPIESELDAFTFTEPAPPEPEPDEEIAVVLEPMLEEPEEVVYSSAEEPDPQPIEEDESIENGPQMSGFTPSPRRRPSLVAPWGRPKSPEIQEESASEEPALTESESEASDLDRDAAVATASSEHPKLKLGIKPPGPQSELSLDSAPRGRFEGESPNVFDGEDLDLPPFLRKKK